MIPVFGSCPFYGGGSFDTYSLFIVAPIAFCGFGFFVFMCICFCNHLDEEERDCFFISMVFWCHVTASILCSSQYNGLVCICICRSLEMDSFAEHISSRVDVRWCHLVARNNLLAAINSVRVYSTLWQSVPVLNSSWKKRIPVYFWINTFYFQLFIMSVSWSSVVVCDVLIDRDSYQVVDNIVEQSKALISSPLMSRFPF